jgi:hypothetical protein
VERDPTSSSAPLDRFLEAVDLEIYRNTPRPKKALETDEVATHAARGHQVGEPTPVYTGCSQPTADAEFRHAHPALVGCEIRSTVLVGRLLLIDATQEAIAEALETSVAALERPNDWSACQRLTREAFAQGAQAVKLRSVRNRPHGANVIVERSAALELLRESKTFYRILKEL